MLEAKCPHCLGRAEVDDDLSFVECRNCDYHDTYLVIFNQTGIKEIKNYPIVMKEV